METRIDLLLFPESFNFHEGIIDAKNHGEGNPLILQAETFSFQSRLDAYQDLQTKISQKSIRLPHNGMLCHS